MNGTARRVVITDFVNDGLEIERAVLDGLARVEALDAHSESDLEGRVESADALMVYHNLGVSSATIARLEQCRVIVRCGVGIDNVDHAAAAERGIPVANVPDYGTEEVADSTVGMMLALTRGVHQYNVRLQRQSGPWMYTIAQPLYRLRDRVFGIVGLGRIGAATAVRAKALGMRVHFFDPWKPDGYDKALGVVREETLESLMNRSHVLSIHCPLTPETHHMINAATLRWMPRGGYLVNTARGAVVDTACIPEAVRSGQLAGAAIDVLMDEPPREDNPLVTAWRDPQHPAHERVILNPHAAFYCEEGLADMRRKGAEACLRALRGQPIRNVVNAVTVLPAAT